MRQIKLFTLSCFALALALLAACGGGGDGDQTPKVKFTSLVTFGDSLSDVGTYNVGTIAAFGGGKYTVNSPSAKNWTEVLASQLGLASPCAAQTGLAGNSGQGFNVTPTAHAGCTNYAQGGARVLHPVGPGNAALGGGNAVLGQLTVPLTTQMETYVPGGSSYTGKELVTVQAGANDLFMQFGSLTTLSAVVDTNTAAAFTNYVVNVAGWTTSEATAVLTAAATGGAPAGIAAAAPIMVSKMSTAGTDLSGLVNTKLVGRGTKYVLVLNLPNISKTPFATSLGNAALVATLDSMTVAFNSSLQAGLGGVAGVKLGDAYTTNTDQFNNPSQYGLSNVTGTACYLPTPATNANPLNSSLICNTNANTSNVISGDISTYLFADTVHPTPYGYKLIAQEAAKHLVIAGWL